jgi:hypothetical protein
MQYATSFQRITAYPGAYGFNPTLDQGDAKHPLGTPA